MNTPPPADPIDQDNDKENKNSADLKKAVLTSYKKQEKTDENLKGVSDHLSNIIRVGTVIEPTFDEKEKENTAQSSSTNAGYHPVARVLVHIGVNHTGEREKVTSATNIYTEDKKYPEKFEEDTQLWIEKMDKIEGSKLDPKNKLENTNMRVWIQLTSSNAGVNGEWSPPSYGEQVLIICINGDISNAFIIGSIYRSSINFTINPSKNHLDTGNVIGAFGETKFPKCKGGVLLPKFGDNNYLKSFKVYGSSGVIGFDPQVKIFWKTLYAKIKSNGETGQYYLVKLLEQIEQLIQEEEGMPAHGETTRKIFHSGSPEKPLVIEKTTIKKLPNNSQETYVGSISKKIFSSKNQGKHSAPTGDKTEEEENEQLLASEELTINKDLGGNKKTTFRRIDDRTKSISSFSSSTAVSENGVETKQELSTNEERPHGQINLIARAKKNNSQLIAELNSTSNNYTQLAKLDLNANDENGEIIFEVRNNNTFCKIEMHPTKGVTIYNESGTSFTMDANGKITVKGKSLNFNAKEITFDGPVKFNQPVTCGSKLTVHGKLDVI